jgi:RNA-splicing ligase RtcB
VAQYHQNKAIQKQEKDLADSREMIIESLKALGREQEIEEHLKTIANTQVPQDLAFLKGRDKKEYLNDMEVAIKFAELNRNIMLYNIISTYQKITNEIFFVLDKYHTIHNYVADGMIRKGAIKATKGTKVTIPMNMRDGSIIAIGRGNPDWNFSAPHGAGRLMSRTQAKKEINLDDYSKEMEGVYSSSVVEETLDEAPMAYKPMESILSAINDSVIVLHTIKPIYNFKAKD